MPHPRRSAKRSVPAVLASACTCYCYSTTASATVFTDASTDQAGGTGTDVVDITSVEVTNDATNVVFKINLRGDISQANVSDFGNYHIGFNTGAGGSTTPAVGWGQVFGMSAGMDYWVGSWVNFGGGAELHAWDSGASALGATIPGTTVTPSQFATTITIPLANLGLSTGSEFDFDVWSTFGTPGGQSAYDASSNPVLAVTEPWTGTPYDASTAGTGGTPLVSHYTVAAVTVISSQWTGAVDNAWSGTGNWSAGVPNGADHAATFGSISTSNFNVSVDGGAKTLGAISFNSATSYSIGTTSGNGITLQVSTGQAAVNVLAGAHTIAAPLTLASDTTITSAASSGVALTGNLTATGRTITKAGAGSVQFENARASSADITAGSAKISLKGTPNIAAGTSVVGSLTIAAGASLDLTNNSAVIDYTTLGTTLTDVREHLENNRLVTSAVSPANTRLGYGDNATLSKTVFGGVSADSSSVLIKFTYAGDADLDGDADGVDIGTWATNFTGELSGAGSNVWTQGDWDYDGDVDGVDAGLWATAFTGELSGGGLTITVDTTLSREAAGILQGLGITVVPEPASLALLAACAAWSLQRPRSERTRRDRRARSSA